MCNSNSRKDYLKKGKPDNVRCENSFVLRFIGSYRRAILDAYIFLNMNDVCELTESRMIDYNENHPMNTDESIKKYYFSSQI